MTESIESKGLEKFQRRDVDFLVSILNWGTVVKKDGRWNSTVETVSKENVSPMIFDKLVSSEGGKSIFKKEFHNFISQCEQEYKMKPKKDMRKILKRYLKKIKTPSQSKAENTVKQVSSKVENTVISENNTIRKNPYRGVPDQRVEKREKYNTKAKNSRHGLSYDEMRNIKFLFRKKRTEVKVHWDIWKLIEKKFILYPTDWYTTLTEGLRDFLDKFNYKGDIDLSYALDKYIELKEDILPVCKFVIIDNWAIIQIKNEAGYLFLFENNVVSGKNHRSSENRAKELSFSDSFRLFTINKKITNENIQELIEDFIKNQDKRNAKQLEKEKNRQIQQENIEKKEAITKTREEKIETPENIITSEEGNKIINQVKDSVENNVIKEEKNTWDQKINSKTSESTSEIEDKKIPEIKNKNIDSTNEINLDTIAEDLKNIQNSWIDFICYNQGNRIDVSYLKNPKKFHIGGLLGISYFCKIYKKLRNKWEIKDLEIENPSQVNIPKVKIILKTLFKDKSYNIIDEKARKIETPENTQHYTQKNKSKNTWNSQKITKRNKKNLVDLNQVINDFKKTPDSWIIFTQESEKKMINISKSSSPQKYNILSLTKTLPARRYIYWIYKQLVDTKYIENLIIKDKNYVTTKHIEPIFIGLAKYLKEVHSEEYIIINEKQGEKFPIIKKELEKEGSKNYQENNEKNPEIITKKEVTEKREESFQDIEYLIKNKILERLCEWELRIKKDDNRSLKLIDEINLFKKDIINLNEEWEYKIATLSDEYIEYISNTSKEDIKQDILSNLMKWEKSHSYLRFIVKWKLKENILNLVSEWKINITWTDEKIILSLKEENLNKIEEKLEEISKYLKSI